jgi:putative membrane protein
MRTRWKGEVRPNRGSYARDHLANERTYLAWLRTGMTFVALGVAAAKFAVFRHGVLSAAGCFALMAAGVVVASYGTARYRAVNRQLNNGVFAAASIGAVFLAGFCILIALVIALIVI